MDSTKERAAQFRKRLISSLNQHGSSFDFSAFVEETGVDAQLARTVAESVFAQFFAPVLEDGEISDRERRQLRKLGDRLEIGDDRRVEIERKVGNRAYREQLRDAQANGVITEDELEELRALRAAFGLGEIPPRRVDRPKIEQSEESTAVGMSAVTTERDSIIAQIEASAEFHARNSVERLERIPRTSRATKVWTLVILIPFIAISMVMCLFFSTVAAHAVITSPPKSEDLPLVLVAFVPAVVSLIMAAIPSLILWYVLRYFRRSDEAPVVSHAGIIERIEGDRSKSYWLKFVVRGGKRQEHQVYDPELAKRLSVRDTGVLFIRQNQIVDFDPIPTTPVSFRVFAEPANETVPEVAYKADRTEVFALVEASPQYAARESAARLKRVPKTPLSHYSLLLTYWVIFTLIGLAISSTLFYFDDGDDVFVIILIGLSFTALPSLPLLFTWLMMRNWDAGPVTSWAAIVVGQHNQQITLVDSAGKQTQHWVRDRKLAERLEVGDAVVLFLCHGWVLDRRPMVVDFDCVLTGDEIREGQMPGAIVCPACATVFRLDDPPTHCENCGAELPKKDQSRTARRRPYSPWIGWLDRWVDRYENRIGGYEIPEPSLKHRVEGRVSCGWCGLNYDERPDSPDCDKCGGPLPMPPGSDAGPGPAASPRKLPTIFLWRLFFTRNPQSIVCGIMLGLSLTCCLPILSFSVPGFILGGLGLFHSLMRSRRRWVALSRGVSVLGTIEHVLQIGEKRGRNDLSTYRYRVIFHFDADGQPWEGVIETMDESITKHYTGEPIWVVHVPNKPYAYAIWPPFA